MNIETIYEDSEIAVLNKPSGISVHGGPNVVGETVADFVRARYPETQSVGDEPFVRPGIVHRLDKNTSGVLLVARAQSAFEFIKELFKARRVEKEYWAIVCGVPRARSGIISHPIGRLAKNPLKRGIAEGRSRITGARDAVTEYGLIKAGKNFSMVGIRPKTGRMHQIRVHMKSIGNPIACDRIYGGKNVCCPDGCSRQLLHARSISFSFPEGRKLFFEADPPDDFKLAEAHMV